MPVAELISPLDRGQRAARIDIQFRDLAVIEPQPDKR